MSAISCNSLKCYAKKKKMYVTIVVGNSSTFHCSSDPTSHSNNVGGSFVIVNTSGVLLKIGLLCRRYRPTSPSSATRSPTFSR